MDLSDFVTDPALRGYIEHLIKVQGYVSTEQIMIAKDAIASLRLEGIIDED